MSEKGANIDLLFRNGLKDYEVLPPPEVWAGIHSAVKIKSRPVVLMRIAALVTVLLTMSFLTYRLSREGSIKPEDRIIAFNIPVSSPIITNKVEIPVFMPLNNNNPALINPDVLNDTANSVLIQPEIADISSPERINFVPATENVAISNREIVRGPFLTSLNTSQESSASIVYPQLPIYIDNGPAKPVNRWSIAAMASPTFYSKFSTGDDNFSDQLIASEQPLISYSGGLSFSYKISKRFSIQSGLYYSSLGEKVDGINSFSGFKPYDITKGDHNFEVLTSNGKVIINNPDIFVSANVSERVLTAYTRDVFDPNKASLQPVSNSLDQNLSYLELPVVLRYKIVDKAFGINLIGGLSYNLLVHNSVYTSVDGNKYIVGDTKGLNPLSFSSSVGMGMEYNFSGKLSLNLEPTFRYYLNPFSVTTGTFIHPYSFGIFSGVSYKF